jgi:valyl-tRNA synthetase
MLINASFSKVSIKADKDIEKQKEIIIDVITEIRRIRADNNIMPNKSINLLLKPKKATTEIFNDEVIFLIS